MVIMAEVMWPGSQNFGTPVKQLLLVAVFSLLILCKDHIGKMITQLHSDLYL